MSTVTRTGKGGISQPLASELDRSKSSAKAKDKPNSKGQVVLVLQGGGALGAYQVGVYQAMHEAGIEPDWVIGTSIGAINAALIAGNAPADRMDKLREFWASPPSSSPTCAASPAWALRSGRKRQATTRPLPWRRPWAISSTSVSSTVARPASRWGPRMSARR